MTLVGSRITGGKRRTIGGTRKKRGGNFLNTLAVPAALLILQKAFHHSKSHKHGRKYRKSKRSKRSR